MARLARSAGAAAWPSMGALVLALSGCASQRTAAPVQVAEAPAATPPMPTRPAGIPDSLTVPTTDAAGNYLTLNHGVGTAQAVWHVRSALNVAALGCRGGEREAAIIAAYNAMLKVQKVPLTTAMKGTESRFRAEQAKGWQTAYDQHMTRLYNFFAQPAAQQRFCEVAAEIVIQAGAVAPAEFTTFAAAALPRLEAPFTDIYRAYDGYRRDLAAWQARYGTDAGTALAAAAPQPAATQPPVGKAAAAVAAAPRLTYAGMDQLLLWDARDRPIRTASR